MDKLSDEGFIIENLFRIADKEGRDVDFHLNPVQRDLDMTISGRDLVPKARQEGVTSYILARFAVACLMRRNTRAVVISHDQESTQRMLKRVKYYLEEIKGPRPVIQNMSANEITFPKMNSMFYIGTAGSRKFGRGDTITHLHCSEYAFWSNPADLMRGLLQAVPASGEIVIESTGNGLNDYYHRCMRAAAGNSRWRLHFYPWHTFPEYQVSMTPEEQEDFLSTLDDALEEPALLARGISVERLRWRHDKLEELDFDLKSFKQEYPETLDECFQMTGDSIFHKVRYTPTEKWQRATTHLWHLDGHDFPGHPYVIGADPSGGVGKDSSAIQVICLECMEQVAEYANNQVDPEQFAYKIVEVAHLYHKPFVVVESNNHGILTLATLEKIYPKSLLYTEWSASDREEAQIATLGYRTTARTKPLLIGNLRSALAHNLTIHSPLLNSQLSTFIEYPNGKLAAQEGCFDDLVMAAACAVRGVNEAASRHASRTRPIPQAATYDPLSLDAALDELRGRAGGYPIMPQHETLQ
jgi:hypothetical protein